jgi:uncharacterized phage protein (TIGR02220 family)
MIYKDQSKEIKNRNISLSIGIKEKLNTPIKEKFKDNVNKNIKSDEDEIDFSSLLKWFNSITGKNLKVVNEKTKKQFLARMKDGYSKSDITRAIKNCFEDDFHKANPKYLTLEFISRPDKFEKYACSEETSNKDFSVKRKELLKSMGI